MNGLRAVVRSCYSSNLVFQQKRFYKIKPKRFYKQVSIAESGGKYEILLDRKKLKTPHGNVFFVQSEGLAAAVAAEWESQGKEIKRHMMHLTALCNTVLDNPMRKTKDDIVEETLRFLPTDTICFLAEEPDDLVQLQKRKWLPIVDWANERFGIDLVASSSLHGPNISAETNSRLRSHLMSFNDWAVLGFYHATDSLKSLLLALAAIDHHVSVEQAVYLARLETEFQIHRWGNVEWYHDPDLHESRVRLASAVIFVYFNAHQNTIKRKGLSVTSPSN